MSVLCARFCALGSVFSVLRSDLCVGSVSSVLCAVQCARLNAWFSAMSSKARSFWVRFSFTFTVFCCALLAVLVGHFWENFWVLN